MFISKQINNSKLCQSLRNFCRIHSFRSDGAISQYIMIKQILIATVLTSLLIGNSWDAEASRRTIRQDNGAHLEHSETKVREKRFINPFNGLLSIWNALTHMYSLYVEVSCTLCDADTLHTVISGDFF